ncbi:MAG: hypothetical protein ACRENF_03095 [Thermodesulfobacteriota bacterium]
MKRLFFLALLGGVFLSLPSCASSKAESNNPDVPGRFVFKRAAPGEVGYPNVYIPKEGVTRKVDVKSTYPSWSPDGQSFASCYLDTKAIYIFDENRNPIKEIKCPFNARDVNWSLDGQKLFYVGAEAKVRKITDTYYLMAYDLKEDKHEKIKGFGLDEEIYRLYLSPDGKRLTFNISSAVNSSVPDFTYLFNLETKEIKKLHSKAHPIGWFPDSRHIAIETNTAPDGTWMNKPHGFVAKLNVETMEFEIIHDNEFHYGQTRLSKDGKYLYYSRNLLKGGRAIFIRSLELNKEVQITKPVPMQGGFSEDAYPDWYQGE